jgi:hypothetical protein
MAEMLLINPRRRKARKSNPRRSAAQRAATRRMIAANPRRRRRNPSPARAIVAANPRKRRMTRRRNPVTLTRRVMRRRRNPSMRFSIGGVIGAIQNAAIQGAGAVAFDLIHGQIQRFLPAMLVPVAGRVGLGDLVKASLTVFLGQALNGPTRGLSSKAATGALTVQAHALIRSFVPSSMPLGYASAGMVGAGSARIGPNRAIVGMGRYTRPGATQLLNAYVQPGATPLLNGSRARMREGIAVR